MVKILDGRALAQNIKDSLKLEVSCLKEETGQVPVIVNVMLGKDDGSCAYANAQKKQAEYMGIEYRLKNLPENISQSDFCGYLKLLNLDKKIHGIMIHKPVPKHIDYSVAANFVDTSKDLEGINVANIGKMILGETKIIPCTPASVMEHIRSTGVPLRGKEVVIIGHSIIVGKPLSILLLEEMATVTVCHVATSEAGKLEGHVKRADILIVAVGRPALIHGDWIKKDAIVIDVGINKLNNKIVGDVDFESAKEKASYITPVPGGVGPVTVVMLMKNAVEAFKMQNSKGL